MTPGSGLGRTSAAVTPQNGAVGKLPIMLLIGPYPSGRLDALAVKQAGTNAGLPGVCNEPQSSHSTFRSGPA